MAHNSAVMKQMVQFDIIGPRTPVVSITRQMMKNLKAYKRKLRNAVEHPLGLRRTVAVSLPRTCLALDQRQREQQL